MAEKTLYAIHCVESLGFILEGRWTVIPTPSGSWHIFSPTNIPHAEVTSDMCSPREDQCFEDLKVALQESRKLLLEKADRYQAKVYDLISKSESLSADKVR